MKLKSPQTLQNEFDGTPYFQQLAEVKLAKETLTPEANSVPDSQLQNNNCEQFQTPIRNRSPLSKLSRDSMKMKSQPKFENKIKPLLSAQKKSGGM